MGERPSLGAPTSIATKAPSISSGRVGLDFSPKIPQSFEHSSAKFNFNKPPSGDIFTPRSLGKSNPLVGIQEQALNSIPKPRNFVEQIRPEKGGQRLPRFENPFGKDWQVIARERPEIVAKRPAVINKNPIERAQEMSTVALEKFKSYTRNVNFRNPNPMDLLEGVEIFNVVLRLAKGGIEISDAPAFLASTILIEGIKMSVPGKVVEGIKSKLPVEAFLGSDSKIAKIAGFAQDGLIHAAERKIAEKVIEKGIKGASEAFKKVKTESIYKKLKAHPGTVQVVAHSHKLVRQGLTEEDVYAQVIAVATENRAGLNDSELAAITKAATKKWVEVRMALAEAEEDDKKPEDFENKKDGRVAELDPVAQAERMEHLAKAVAKAPVDEIGRLQSQDVAKKMPKQIDKPKVTSEARYWYGKLAVYDEQPDGSYPQSIKEIEASGLQNSRGSGLRSFTTIFEKNIPIRWRKKKEQTQKIATKKQKDLVFERIADDVAREAAGSLIT